MATAATLVSVAPLADENANNSSYQNGAINNNSPSRTNNNEELDDSNPDYQDYWNEFKEIEIIHSDEETEDDTKTPDECEQDMAWLKEVGYGHLATRFEDGHDFSEDELEMLTATLTHIQAKVVRKRVVNLTATLRRRPRTTSKTDVRDIFPQEVFIDPLPEPYTAFVFHLVQERRSSVRVRPKRKSDPETPLRRTESTPVGRGGLRRGSKGKDSFKKNAYSMTGVSKELTDNTDSDISTLSLQTNIGAPTTPTSPQPLSAISDSEVTLQFVESDEKEDRENRLEYSESDKRDTLPHFILVKDDWGITRIEDLGPNDLNRISALALIELTALYDTHNLIYSRRKHKRRNKETGIFGVSLETLVEQNNKASPGVTVPLFFSDIITHLEKTALSTEGVLRIPGSTSRLKSLRQSIEEKYPQNQTFLWDDVLPHDAAGLLKQFLRELPTPLLTFQYIDAFFQIECISEKVQQLKALNLLTLVLPPVHRDTLKMLLRFLRKVVKRSSENLMGLNNVAMIIAPNLFLPKSKTVDITSIELSKAAGTSNIVKMLIKYHHILWTVPSFMIMQIRHQIEQEQQRKARDKNKIKFLGRKDKHKDAYQKPTLVNEADFKQGVIRVQAPQLTKSSAAVQLNEDTTAGDIVEKFRCDKPENFTTPQRSPIAKSPTSKKVTKRTFSNPNDSTFAEGDTYLFEVGGNIGERRLDHGANMMALYKLNPNAEWIVKSKV